MNSFVAGLVSAVPLSVAGVAVMLIWGGPFVAALKAGGMDVDPMTDDQMRLLFLGTFALAPLMFGAVSAQVLNWVKDPSTFRLIVFGLAVLMSVLALVLRTPMALPKIAANLAVALAFGLLLPVLAR